MAWKLRHTLWLVIVLCGIGNILFFDIRERVSHTPVLQNTVRDPEMENIQELVDLLRSRGAFIHRCLVVRRCPPYGGRCMRTECELPQGEVLISIPPELQITGRLRTPCPELAAALEKVKSFHVTEETSQLILHLLEERALGPASVFRNYVAMLPMDYPSVLWNESDQLLCLAGTPAEMHIQRRIERDAALGRVLHSCATGSSHDFNLWAKLAVDTRAFSGWADDETSNNLSADRAHGGHEKPTRHGHRQRREWNALVPFADICNDGLDPNARWTRNVGSKVFVVDATRNIASGSEVLISYGRKGNEKLLARYGFYHKDNPYEIVNIDLGDENAFAHDRPPPTLILSLGDVAEPEALRRALRPLADFRADSAKNATHEARLMMKLANWCDAAKAGWTRYQTELPALSHRWLCDGYREGLATVAGACYTFAMRAASELRSKVGTSNRAEDRAAQVLMEVVIGDNPEGHLAKALLQAWRETWNAT